MLITFILHPDNAVETQVGALLVTMLINALDSETLLGLMYHVTH